MTQLTKYSAISNVYYDLETGYGSAKTYMIKLKR